MGEAKYRAKEIEQKIMKRKKFVRWCLIKGYSEQQANFFLKNRVYDKSI